MPATAFYEWHLGGDGKKNPHLIKLADQEIFGFTALWDRSRTGVNGTSLRHAL
jgi:putative SOS response-associated peptidase YedK